MPFRFGGFGLVTSQANPAPRGGLEQTLANPPRLAVTMLRRVQVAKVGRNHGGVCRLPAVRPSKPRKPPPRCGGSCCFTVNNRREAQAGQQSTLCGRASCSCDRLVTVPPLGDYLADRLGAQAVSRLGNESRCQWLSEKRPFWSVVAPAHVGGVALVGLCGASACQSLAASPRSSNF